MLDNRWHEAAVDTNLLLQLQDLTITLATLDVELEFAYGSFIDVDNKRVTASTRWEMTKPSIQRAGYQTDIYLRTLGTLHATNLQAIQSFGVLVSESPVKNFALQLVTLLEDMRLEENIKQRRPGTHQDFALRTSYLRRFFTHELTTNMNRKNLLDELFCMIYLTLQGKGPEQNFVWVTDQSKQILEFIRQLLYESFTARSTEEIVNLATQIIQRIHIEQDMTKTYFTFPIEPGDQSFRERTLFDELTRTDDVANDDSATVDPEKSNYDDETFSTWHFESEAEERQQTFLQMDLDVGTKTNLLGGEARETESGDQAFASAVGQSKETKQEDYSKKEALERRYAQSASEGKDVGYSAEAFGVKKIIKYADEPTDEEGLIYDRFVSHIEVYKRQLMETIKKFLAQKQTAVRDRLRYGRLSKNLLPIVFNEHPRLFYKKNYNPSEFDAVFTLLIDCSASMTDKMEETKRGIVLFHEVLKELKIPHKIVGFWEEASTGLSKEQPNYFHVIHSFTTSLYDQQGAKIMQLEPREDNRDGYSIRQMTKKMLLRQEKHKLLLVFSDGEPSAHNYEQEGLIDTHRAVAEARKLGIDVIGLFLAKDAITKRDERMMKDIYGHQRVMVPQVKNLPERFLPILKKLILKTI